MNIIKSLFAFLFMLVATLFTASDTQAFALGNHAGGFFLGTLDCTEENDSSSRNLCRENGWLNYDTLSGSSVATKTIPTPTDGQKVYRVYGGDAKAGGASWSPTNPADASNYRNAAGLPSGGASGANNTGQFVIEGTLTDPSKVVKTRSALPLDGNQGGLPEYIIPNALDNGAVRVDRVSGVNPEF